LGRARGASHGEREGPGRRAQGLPRADHLHPRADERGRVRDRGDRRMKPVLSPQEAVELDRATQARGVAAEDLMERAGWAVARACADLTGGTYGRRAVVVCGKGNNGGDGFVTARHLARWGMRAVDIPSGVDGTSAAVEGVAVRADLTVSFGAAKTGTVLLPGAAFAGDVRVVDIGFPDELIPTTVGVTEPGDVAKILPDRAVDAHTG